MRFEDAPPSGHLMSSMRAVGYSLPTAIADIVDNSVAHAAAKVDIFLDSDADHPHIAILDDGEGMTAATAREAMRLAGTSATETRNADDLGRFGLGLKTASLSQCRVLTVVTLRDGKFTALTWDLDVIERSGEWRLSIHDRDELAELPHFENLRSLASGTLVIWRELDRLLDGVTDISRHLDTQMIEVKDHLSLVFHRFISGDQARQVKIAINHVPISAIDPFLKRSSQTQPSPLEQLAVRGELVTVQAFTLPFVNKMTRKERESSTTIGSLRETQGFYIYRGKRLVSWGTWFRLAPKNEMGRLTRVQVDIPNSLDHLWSLDIKKSSAIPPSAVRDRLRELASRFVEPSERAHKFRGRRLTADESFDHMWNVVEDRGAVRYELNRSHPAMLRLSDGLSQSSLSLIESLFDIIEASLPVQDLFNRMSLATPVEQDQSTNDTIEDALVSLWLIGESTETPEDFFDFMTHAEPFNRLTANRNDVVERLTKGRSAP